MIAPLLTFIKKGGHPRALGIVMEGFVIMWSTDKACELTRCSNKDTIWFETHHGIRL